jgi:Acetyltransferase (GNAT) domain
MNRPDISSNQQAYAQARAFTPSDAPGGDGPALGPAGALTAPYTCRVFNSIDDVDLVAWRRVCTESGASIFMDPRFIAAVESAMKPDCRFWYVIVYGGDGRPAACAGLSAMAIDVLDFGDPRARWIIRRAPKLLSKFRKLKGLFCSLPGSPGEKCLALASADTGPILAALDAVMCGLAADTGMDAIIYKEFGQNDLQGMGPLLACGYRQIEIPPMHLFEPSFENFAQYCAALKKKYRQTINRSMRKLNDVGVKQSILTEPDEILSAYTPEVHAMYREVAAKSDLKLEVFPIEYYHQMALRLKGQLELVAFFKDSRIIAFGWCLHDKSTYHMMYAGIDYKLNPEFDLYFNLMYALLDRALQKRVTRINVGQTATVFKARMGCYSEPLYVFVKGVGPLMSKLFYYGANFLVIKKPSNPPADIFRREGGETLK